MLAVLVGDDAAGVHEHAAGAPRAERRVAEGIAERGVRGGKAVIRAAVAGEHHHVLVAHLADAGRLEEIELAGILALVQGRIRGSFRVADLAVLGAGRDEVVMELGAGPHGIHGALVQLAGRGMLEAVVDVGPVADAVVRILAVRDGLDEDGGVEVDEGARQDAAAVLGDVDRLERPVRTVGLAHGGDPAATAGVRVQVIRLLSRRAVSHLHEVGRVHRVPLAVHEPGEEDALVAPLAQVLHRGRPHADVAAAVGGIGEVVRADDVRPVLPGLVGILENAGLAVGEMLPQRQIRVLRPGRCHGEQGGQKEGNLLHGSM